MDDLFLLGDFEGHMRWFRIRVQEYDMLGWLVYALREWRTYAGYWQRLEDWAGSDPADADRRRGLLREHRALMERVTAKMVL